MVKIIIDGVPVGKGRPRFSRSGVYTPKETRIYESHVQYMFNMQVESKEMLLGSVRANVLAYFPIPKSTSKKNRALMLENKLRPTVKPDLDNIAKIILDSLNKLSGSYHDDSQIVDLNVSKYYSENPRVEVELEEV